MDNAYLNLMTFLLKKDKRQVLEPIVKKIKLDAPFDIVLDELMMSKTDITKADLLDFVKGKLNSTEFNYLKGMSERVTTAVGYRSIHYLQTLTQLKEVGDVLKSRVRPEKKLERINVASDVRAITTQAVAKPISEFVSDTTNDLLSLFYYGVSREELAVLCAFSGRGKTTILLSLVRQAIRDGLKVLFVSVQDFSEGMLKERIATAHEFPDFYAVCSSSFGIPELEVEVDSLMPDVVFLDYMSVLDAPQSKEKRFQLEYISENLKRVAQNKKIAIITAHQLNADVNLPSEKELLEAKAGLLAHTDLVLGIGGDMYDTVRNVTTIKSRRAAPVDVFKVDIDFANLNTSIF
tara:strand:- start:4034 stop:5080 length:1047 start_codon:yes stop_codon:yes gene_type:complete